MLRLRRILWCWLSAAALAGCAITPFSGRQMETRVGEDIASFNQAYADATGSLILWNVLRARDRLPRSYVAIKDIATTQTRALQNDFGLSALDFGSGLPSDPWAVGALSGRTTTQSAPNYGIAPLSAEGLSAAVQNPTRHDVFEHYWNSWGPADVLMAVLVQRATRLSIGDVRTARLARASDFSNSYCVSGDPVIGTRTSLQAYLPSTEDYLNNEIDDPGDSEGVEFETEGSFSTSARPTSAGARFLRLARWAKEGRGVRLRLMQTRACDPTARIALRGEGAPTLNHAADLARTIAGGTAHERVRLTDDGFLEVRSSADVAAVLLVMEDEAIPEDLRGVWELELRSFDGAIFYLGESIREPSDGPPRAEFRASRNGELRDGLSGPAPSDATPEYFGVANVVAADCDEISVNAPLFRVRRLPAGNSADPPADGWNFDTYTPAARVRYRDALYESGPPSPLNSSCNTRTDFSGQVLSLLTQLLAATYTPDALRLPARIN